MGKWCKFFTACFEHIMTLHGLFTAFNSPLPNLFYTACFELFCGGHLASLNPPPYGNWVVTGNSLGAWLFPSAAPSNIVLTAVDSKDRIGLCPNFFRVANMRDWAPLPADIPSLAKSVVKVIPFAGLCIAVVKRPMRLPVYIYRMLKMRWFLAHCPTLCSASTE